MLTLVVRGVRLQGEGVAPEKAAFNPAGRHPGRPSVRKRARIQRCVSAEKLAQDRLLPVRCDRQLFGLPGVGSAASAGKCYIAARISSQSAL